MKRENNSYLIWQYRSLTGVSMRGSNEVSVRNKECIEERMERIKNGRGKKRECEWMHVCEVSGRSKYLKNHVTSGEREWVEVKVMIFQKKV